VNVGDDHVRVAAHRDVRATAEQVESVLQDTGSYPSWVEGLVRFEPCAGGCYIGELGYLGRRKQRLLRRTSSERSAIAWETCDPNPNRSRIRWEVRVTPTGPRASRVSIAFEKSGSGSVFGKSASSPLFRAALRAVADRSLERLAEIVADAHEEQHSPTERRAEASSVAAGPDWERIRSYYALFNDTEQIKAAVKRISAGGQLDSSGGAGTLDFIDSPYSAHLILASFPLDRHASVIDVGAGLGGSSRLYAATAGRVTAVDILEEQVEAHRALNDTFNVCNIDIVRADAQSLPFRDEVFTHYFSIGALCHTFDRRAALSEAHRALRPGGAIAVVDCVAGPAPGPEYWGERFWKLIPAEEYLSLARHVGFEDVELSDIRRDYAAQLELYVRLIENTPEIFEVRFGGKERLREALETYRGFLEGFRRGRVGVIWLKAARSL
jgi:SAM-dependent methyltransferase